MEKTEIRNKCLGFIRDTINNSAVIKKRERAQTNQDFVRGNQYTAEEHNVYKSKGVEPVTINRCRPVLKSMLGMYLQNKQSIKVMPRKGGTQNVAMVYTELIKHTEDNTHADYLYTDLIRRGGIDTESYLRVVLDKQQNPNGQLMFKVKSIEDVVVDPNADEYDINQSARYFVESQWRDIEEIKATYPDNDNLSNAFDLSGDKELDGLISYLSDNDIEDNYNQEQDEDLELKKKYRYRIRTVVWKEIVSGLLVIDKQTNMVRVVSDQKIVKKLKKATKGMARFETKSVPAFILHETVMLGSEMLEDTVSPFGDDISDLPMFRFSPYWDDGYSNGVIDDIIGLNREENIHRTQAIKIINTTANSGWKTKGGTQQKKKELANVGSVEGIVIDETEYGNSVEKIAPNPLPTGLFMMGQQFEQDIKRVSGFDDATMGYETGAKESGRAIGLKQQQNQVSAEPIFDNFYRTLNLAGNFVLKVIRKLNIYTEQEIIEVVENSSLIDVKLMEKARSMFIAQTGSELPEPAPIQPPPPEVLAAIRPQDKVQVMQTIAQGMSGAQEYTKAYPRLKTAYDDMIKQHAIAMLMEELKSDSVADYGIVVTVSASSPTERLARFMEMDAVQSKYPNTIPADIFIDATDLPNKDEIKARIQQVQQQQMQMQAQGAA